MSVQIPVQSTVDYWRHWELKSAKRGQREERALTHQITIALQIALHIFQAYSTDFNCVCPQHKPVSINANQSQSFTIPPPVLSNHFEFSFCELFSRLAVIRISRPNTDTELKSLPSFSCSTLK